MNNLDKPVLTQEYLSEILAYDPFKGVLTWKERPVHFFKEEKYCKGWNKRYANQPAFTATDLNGYKIGRINDVAYRAHRIIWLLVYGVESDKIDHIDGDPSNNILSNLRSVSSAENSKNVKRNSLNKSGVTGVSWLSSHGKWRAAIGIKGKSVHIGLFDSKEDAIKARKNAEIENKFHENHGR